MLLQGFQASANILGDFKLLASNTSCNVSLDSFDFVLPACWHILSIRCVVSWVQSAPRTNAQSIALLKSRATTY